MYNDWTHTTRELSTLFKSIGTGVPQVAKGFSDLADAAMAEGALSARTKELMALAVSIATQCTGCIAFHAKAASRLGASRQEVLETIGLAIYMGGGPSFSFGAQALEAYDQFANT